ncbi:hypothetical protein ACO0RG_000066 [Hanseniaspora osmophila]|uniref:DUF1748-domain-containing protein n=1 Tax=Hanseniaspora osmophila TaxID=56408 RepID=A0A1E5R4N9_9ASCO|nr:Uncharacterized protein AWRI3579_g3557 [Hanseniaspora osmophila]
MTLTGKLIHYSFDLMLVSTVLAGVRRQSGLQLKPDFFLQDEQAQKLVTKYLNFGESTLDYITATAGGSSSFVRK